MRSRLTIFLLVMSAGKMLAQHGIDTTQIISIGGIKHYISLKGKDNKKPLLLYLHGGPGGSVMDYADKFTSRLKEHFVVVQWDQRETGKTLQLNASPVPLSLAIFQNDTYALIKQLLNQFRHSKLYLAGHSWGTTLGFFIAEKYPELLFAYIAIGPMINQCESERVILKMMKERAIKDGNKKEIAELNKVNIPFENGEQLYLHRKWLFHFNGQTKTLSREYVLNWASTWLSIYNEASKINLLESLPAINCPVYFFIGKKDYQTNFNIAESYYNKLTAPKKKLFWFDAAHAIPTAVPQQFQSTIIQKVLPETLSGL